MWILVLSEPTAQLSQIDKWTKNITKSISQKFISKDLLTNMD